MGAPLTERYKSFKPMLDQDEEKKSMNPKSYRSVKSYLSKENKKKVRKDLNKFCIECQEKDP